MPIFQGSRYASSRYTAFVDSTGSTRKYVHPPVPHTESDLNGDFKVLTKIAGDELDAIAFENNGRERQWHMIADVSGLTDYPFELPQGTQLVVPSPAQFARFA